MVRTEADELKEAKYREIRDAELDHASGKLSDEDYAILDGELRKEAVEILDAVGVGAGTGSAPRAGRAGMPSDYGDSEGNGNGDVEPGGNGVATTELPTNGNGNGNADHAEGNGNGNGDGNGHHPEGNGNGTVASGEPADRD
jgi:hypothetical protein